MRHAPIGTAVVRGVTTAFGTAVLAAPAAAHGTEASEVGIGFAPLVAGVVGTGLIGGTVFAVGGVRYRRQAHRVAPVLALVLGGVSHLFLDLFVIRVDRFGPPYLFPLTAWLPPAGNLYASTDVWPAAVAIALAVPVWIARRRR
jgi:hypothetical protein